jgi:hypothetical protein
MQHRGGLHPGGAAADELAKKPGHEQHKSAIKTKSSRPLLKAFDESLLPAISADGTNAPPWPVLAATGIDAKGKASFAKYLDQLDGKTVTLTGFMQPVKDELAATGFLLLEYPVGCWFCEVPDPTGLLNVELKAGNNELEFEITGTNPSAREWGFGAGLFKMGLDYVLVR